MTIQQHASFDSSAAELNATSKLVKAWESKNAKNAARAGGVSLMALSLAACGGSSDTAADDTAADDTAADDTTTPVADPVVEGSPSVGFDKITGTAGADVANYFVVQNANGEQTNQFGTGDQINLAGGADVLNVVVQDASSLGAGPAGSIAAYLTGVETANFTALNDSDTENNGASGGDTVEINGAFWLGTDVISSVASDASLTVYNVNTLGSADAYGDVGALTSTMTVRMDHTGNMNLIGDESDMTVLFDEDYLIAGSTTSASDATFFILDQDGAEQGGAATALMHAVDADNRVDAAGETTVFTDSIGISFELNGVVTSISLTDAQIEAAVAADSYTHTDFVADLNENGGLPDGVTVAVDTTTLRTTFLDDGSAYSIPAIVVSSANGGTFSNQSFVSREATGVEFNEYGRFENTDPTTSGQTEINVELLKVGRDGDGGDLIIGGMEDSGIQVFNVEVQGRADQPTSLASLASTNNTLEEVNVVAAAGAEASLEIGNGNTNDGTVAGAGSVSTAWTYAGTASAANNGLVDVRVLDASTFDNGITVNGVVTDASVAKYMDRTDTNGNPSADNADFAYTTGAGADAVNLVISQANLEASGTANREDFSMAVSTGAGNDTVEMQIGDGTGLPTEAWYINHQLMDANADSRIGVDAGAGDDMVHTNGSSVFRIDLGAGNDAGYTDNSGAAKAAWIFNDSNNDVLLTSDIDDIVSDANDSYALYQQTVNVDYKGYIVSKVITDFNTTDLEMNNMIKELISGDEHLSDLIVAEDGPGNSLVVTSLIDGVVAANELAVSLTANTTIADQSDATIGLFNAANNITDTTPTTAEVQTAVNNGLAAFNTAADYNSQLAQTSSTTVAKQTITIGADATVAGTTSVVIGGLTVAVVVGVDNVAAQTTAMVNAINAATDLVLATGDTTTGVVTVTAQGAAEGLDLAAITATTTATGPTFTIAETADGSTGVGTHTGANSSAENDNTITDGTGEDTIVLSTDLTSAEQVVLVLDGDHDMIVNFTGGGNDTINVDAYMTNLAATTSATVTDATGVAGAVVTGVLTDGGIVIDDAHASNDTLAEIQALVTTADGGVSTAATEGLYIVQDAVSADGGDTGTVYLVQDGIAAGDATVTEIDTITLLGVDLGGLVAADFVI